MLRQGLRLNKTKINFAFALGLHSRCRICGEVRLRLNKTKINFAFALGLH